MGILEKLYEPFNSLSTRRGRGGFYKFVRFQDVVDRMNQVFGIEWSSEAVFQEVINSEVILRVRVTIKHPESKEWFFQEGFGGALLNSGDEPGNAFKSAYSKALKDACKKLGVALHLKESDIEESEISVSTPPTPYTAKDTTNTAPTPVAPEQPQAPVAAAVETPPAAPLPPNVPPVVENTTVVTQEVVENNETPVIPQTPDIPEVSEAAVPKTDTSSAPAVEVPAANEAPMIPPSVEVQQPSRPKDVPLSPAERVLKAKKKEQVQQPPQTAAPTMPAVPEPNVGQPTVNTPNETSANEDMITSVQKVAIEGLIEMKNLNYEEVASEALNLSKEEIPTVENLTHTQAISVIQKINNP